MKLLFINTILRFIRVLQGRPWAFEKCVLPTGEKVDLWEIKPGMVFRMESEKQWNDAQASPIIAWRRGAWGCWTLPVSEFTAALGNADEPQRQP